MPRPFPLTSVLQLRQQKETAAERSLATANAAAHAAALRLRDLQQAMQEHAESRSLEVGETLSAAHYQLVTAQWKALQSQRDAQYQVLVQLERQRREQQEHFLHARRQREIVDTLQSDFRTAEIRASEKLDQLRLDDLSGSRVRKQKQAESAYSD